MLVNIDEIKEGGLERAWDLTRESLDESVRGHAAGYRAREALHVEGRLQKVADRIIFDAKAKAKVTAPCGRCLVPVEVEVPLEFEITYVPGGQSPGETTTEHGQHDTGWAAGSFGTEAADEEVYRGKVIDLDPVLREELQLALPPYPVCQEGCKGLCSVCGANLNERDCGCDRRVPDPRWAALEKLKNKK